MKNKHQKLVKNNFIQNWRLLNLEKILKNFCTLKFYNLTKSNKRESWINE